MNVQRVLPVGFLTLLSLGLAVLLRSVTARPLPPFNLRCDHNLVGLSSSQLGSLHSRHLFATDSERPLLSWSLAHSDRGVGGQQAFRVVVARDVEFSQLVWDSGVVESDQQHAMYGGPPLESELQKLFCSHFLLQIPSFTDLILYLSVPIY